MRQEKGDVSFSLGRGEARWPLKNQDSVSLIAPPPPAPTKAVGCGIGRQPGMSEEADPGQRFSMCSSIPMPTVGHDCGETTGLEENSRPTWGGCQQ